MSRRKMAWAVVLIFGFTLIYWLSSGDQVDEAEYEIRAPANQSSMAKTVKRSYGVYGDFQPPLGAYDCSVALDRSGSIPDADREIGRTMVDSVAGRVHGKNRLHIAEFANTYETFGQAEGEEGIRELLGRWRRSTQYPEDRKFTNITMTLANLLQRVVPVIKQGYLVEIIIVTDGDHDPPPDQDDVQYQAEIDDALQKIDYEHSDRLRIHVIEVGDKFAFRGKVATEFLQGRATTLQASTWEDVLPIVEKLQSALQGSFSLTSASAAELRIPVPEDQPEELGPFALKLTGPSSAKFRVRLEPEDATVADKITGFIKVNSGRPRAFDDSSLEISADDRIFLQIKGDENRALEPSWKKYFSSRLWTGREWVFTMSLEPRDNIMPLQDLGGSRDFTVYADPLWFDDGLQAFMYLSLAFGLLLAGLVVLALFLSRGRDEAEEQEEDESEEELDLEFSPDWPFGRVVWDGGEQILSGPETPVDDKLLFTHGPEGIFVRPSALFDVRHGGQSEVYYSDLPYLLPSSGIFEFTERKTNITYQLILQRGGVFPPVTMEEVS